MCKFFLQGNCQFGAHCRNAHSQEEVNAALAAEAGGYAAYGGAPGYGAYGQAMGYDPMYEYWQ